MKKLVRLLLITAGVMIIPLAAGRIIEGWDWGPMDYVFAGIMIFGVGALFELGRSMSRNSMYRAGFTLALASGFMIIWGNGAVGFIGSEDNPINLLYLGVLALGFLAAIASRFQPRGMATTMFAIALGVALIPVAALITKSAFQEIPEAAGVLQVFVFNSFFVLMFIGSGLLFRNAALDAADPAQH